ncbi:MAG: hydroxysqualene dehydroxylase HpnE [Casimicrobiaceae bacterium]|nr:hydroxysqualene dehydroxylase HpnE [Casimicrobiaceae bacterium]MDW8311349.1 hydroxysqualene dehydroxylase HpnE [Burkholderiales bacterium]
MEDRDVRVAVVGAGWAGAVATACLAEAGLKPLLFEATAVAGGRARRVLLNGRSLDNGQHLLIGAYKRALDWIDRFAGSTCYHRLPLSIRTFSLTESGGFAVVLELSARRRPPWQLGQALLNARGFSFVDRLRALFRCRTLLEKRPPFEQTVRAWLAELPAPIRERLFEPLCLGALNTAPERASARVFAEVLRRTFARACTSDFIVPRVDLSRLLPEPVLEHAARNGARIQLADPVVRIERCELDRAFLLHTRSGRYRTRWLVLAVAPQHAGRLLAVFPEADRHVQTLARLEYESIATVHFDFAFAPGLDPERTPLLQLDGEPGQWLFAQRQPGGGVRVSVVISALSQHWREAGTQALAEAVGAQLRRRWPAPFQMPTPVWSQALVEKRATYACTPQTVQALAALPWSLRIGHDLAPRLVLAGDWTVPELPATLEAAVISGERAAREVIQQFTNESRADEVR